MISIQPLKVATWSSASKPIIELSNVILPFTHRYRPFVIDFKSRQIFLNDYVTFFWSSAKDQGSNLGNDKSLYLKWTF